MVNRFPGQVVRGSDTEVLWARKTADESVTSSTTLQNDDTLLVSVEASAVYEFALHLAVVGNTTGDFKMGFTFPTSSTCWWSGKGGVETDAGFGASGSTRHSVSFGDASGTAVAYTGSTTILSIHVMGVLSVSTTAGTLQLQWAQNTSNATATTVKAGSFLRAQRRE